MAQERTETTQIVAAFFLVGGVSAIALAAMATQTQEHGSFAIPLIAAGAASFAGLWLACPKSMNLIFGAFKSLLILAILVLLLGAAGYLLIQISPEFADYLHSLTW